MEIFITSVVGHGSNISCKKLFKNLLKKWRACPPPLPLLRGPCVTKNESIGPTKPKPPILSNKSLILTLLINEKNWDCQSLIDMDVFRGQTTDHVAQILDSPNIKVVKVPANMTQDNIKCGFWDKRFEQNLRCIRSFMFISLSDA